MDAHSSLLRFDPEHLLDLAHVAVRDMENRLVVWTRGMERLYGWTRAEALGRVSHALLETQFPEPLEQIEARLLRHGRWTGELVHTRRDGTRIVVASHWELQRDAAGEPLAVLEINNDITELKRAKEALQQADRRKDDFLAMLAHELRNPLTPIRNATQFLRLQTPRRPEMDRAWDLIDRQVQQLTRLVDDVLDASRIGRGKVSLRPEAIDLAAVLNQAIETSRPLLEARRQTLTFSLSPQSMRVQADPARLAQVVSNLLNNAAKFTPEGGQIFLTVEREADEALVRVEDTGIGISAAMLPRIFDLFAQADVPAGHSQGGLGIGLTLVRSLVEMHGGAVEVHSDGLGHGSEFLVRLPILIEDDAPAAGEDRRVASATRRRVLIVDDDRGVGHG